MKKIMIPIITAALLFTFSASLFASDISESITKVLSDGTVYKRSSVELVLDDNAEEAVRNSQNLDATAVSDDAALKSSDVDMLSNENTSNIDSDSCVTTTKVLSDGTVHKRSSVALISNGNAATSVYGMSVGTGYVDAEDPLFGKPRAHAVTAAFQGSYRVSAKCDVLNSDGSSYTTDWKHEYNAVSAITDVIYAGTSKCTFTGYYEIEVIQGVITSDNSSISF